MPSHSTQLSHCAHGREIAGKGRREGGALRARAKRVRARGWLSTFRCNSASLQSRASKRDSRVHRECVGATASHVGADEMPRAEWSRRWRVAGRSTHKHPRSLFGGEISVEDDLAGRVLRAVHHLAERERVVAAAAHAVAAWGFSDASDSSGRRSAGVALLNRMRSLATQLRPQPPRCIRQRERHARAVRGCEILNPTTATTLPLAFSPDTRMGRRARPSSACARRAHAPIMSTTIFSMRSSCVSESTQKRPRKPRGGVLVSTAHKSGRTSKPCWMRPASAQRAAEVA